MPFSRQCASKSAFGKDQVGDLDGEAVRHAIAHKDDGLTAFTRWRMMAALQVAQPCSQGSAE